MDQETLEFYASPGRFTSVGPGAFSSTDVHEVVDVVQGLLVYDTVARPFYGVELAAQQAEAIHERDTARLLELALTVDGRPLNRRGPPPIVSEHGVMPSAGSRSRSFGRAACPPVPAAGSGRTSAPDGSRTTG